MDVAWVALSLVPHVGGKTLKALLDKFGTPHAILQASATDLTQVAGVGTSTAQHIRAIRLAHVEQAMGEWQQAGVHILTQDDPRYPPALHPLDDKPPTLFVWGNLATLSGDKAVAIVGTRNPSPKARVLARKLSENYARVGYTVVSGLAMGVDRLAHEGAISIGQGRTLAVLGSGVLNIYPPQNSRLAQHILERGGALVCECAPTATVHSSRLVARNRLISGLAQVLVLIESDIDGGAMHAVRFARLQGRPIHTANFPATGNQHAIQEGVQQILSI